MQVQLAQPRGFCAGVRRAIEIVEHALERYGAPVYVLHEIVHNRYVVESLRERGAVFVETLAEVPQGAHCIFSAHGVATSVVKGAEGRQLHVLDATCPLVTKVHSQAQRYEANGYEIVIIGHRGHPEVIGTEGRLRHPAHILCSADEARHLQVRNADKLAYVTQTTLSLDDTRDVIAALQSRFPKIQGPDVSDICYATQNRQSAVRDMVKNVDLLLVVGAHNSSNSNRLREMGAQEGIPSYLIETEEDVDPNWLTMDTRIGMTAGASAPEVLVERVLAYLSTLGVNDIVNINGVEETTIFKLPGELL
jgi:4-hydroxy-3-methylbut-2-enyl diphosphate reductase